MTWPELRVALLGLPRNPLLRRAWTVQRGRTLGLLAFFGALVVLGAAAPAALSLAIQDPTFPLKKAFLAGYQLSITAACVALFLGAIGQVTMAVQRERSSRTLPGLTLTPLNPPELALGLWTGSVLGSLGAGLLALPVSFVAAGAAGVPALDWAGIWVLVLGSAAVCHLGGLLFALSNPKPEQAASSVVGVFVLLWFVIGPLLALFGDGQGRGMGWYLGPLFLTPIPALVCLWDGSFKMMGNAGYLLGLLACAGAAPLLLEACCRKLRDPGQPLWSRRTLLLLAGVHGLVAGHLSDGSPGGPRIDGILALLAWGLPAALVAVPKRDALEAHAWRGTPERDPARRFLALGLLLAAGAFAVGAFAGGARIAPDDPLRWAGAALTALLFAELLALGHAFFRARGAVVALLLFVGVNLLPALVAGFLTRWRHDEFWFVPWGIFTSNLSVAQIGRLVAGLAVAVAGLMRLARMQEARAADAVAARKAALLSASRG